MIHMLSLHVSQQERLWKLSQIETNQAKMPKNHRDLISLNPVPQIIIKKKSHKIKKLVTEMIVRIYLK